MNINNLDLHWLGHSSFLIKTEDKKIYIDPYNLSSDAEKADIIILTHPHYDHCSLEDIQKIVKSGTIIVCPADCQSKISRIEEEIDLKIIDAGQTMDLNGIALGSVPAYNQDNDLHPKSERWLGYLIKLGETTIYHAGDTDLIPEMEQLTGNVKIALLPIDGNYTMNSEEAAKAALTIKPEIAIPMHYGSSVAGTREDAENFKKLCESQGIKAEILEKE